VTEARARRSREGRQPGWAGSQPRLDLVQVRITQLLDIVEARLAGEPFRRYLPYGVADDIGAQPRC
jgi:hypothetical protein